MSYGYFIGTLIPGERVESRYTATHDTIVLIAEIPLRKLKSSGSGLQQPLFSPPVKRTPHSHRATLPVEDNTAEGLKALLEANLRYRRERWPDPFHRTIHQLHQGDARDLSWLPDSSVHLVVTCIGL